ncbi:TPA: CDP-alcohol phosphatidyltransferase family protein [Legionella bozemanae]|uniref:CDP-alcohol phosphatidyltransferase family protein n=1 Tax=Legionella bozemanae TaxID=447 RepID=UPI00399CEDA6
MIKEKSRTWQKVSMLLGNFFATYSPFPAGFYTINSLVLAMIAIFCSYCHYYVAAILLFLLAGIFDVIDGSVARARNKASSLGAFVDGTIDRFVDFAIIFSYFFCEIKAFYLSLDQLICITSFVVILPSFIVAYANHRGAVSDDNETLIWRVMNRGEMLFFMIGILITSLFSAYWAGVLLIFLIFLSTLTIIQTIFLTIYHANKHTSM